MTPVVTTKLKAFTRNGANSYFNKPHISTSPGTDAIPVFVGGYLPVGDESDTSHGAGANLVNYLRGDRTNEGVETDNAMPTSSALTCWAISSTARVSPVITSPQVLFTVGPGPVTFPFEQCVAIGDGLASPPTTACCTRSRREDWPPRRRLVVERLPVFAIAASLDPTNATKAADAATVSCGRHRLRLPADTQIGREQWAFIPSFVMPNLYRSSGG